MRNSASLLPTPNATATPRLHKADLHLLAIFMTVAQCGGFAAAQVALNVSQPTISRKIGDLERGLGMRLCQRGRAGFHLTDKGRVGYARWCGRGGTVRCAPTNPGDSTNGPADR